MEKGVHLKAIVKTINSCGVSFDVWEKQDNAKGVITMDWTSLMGNEKKRVFKLLPDKILITDMGIHNDTRDTVVQIWKVKFFSINLYSFLLEK